MHNREPGQDQSQLRRQVSARLSQPILQFRDSIEGKADQRVEGLGEQLGHRDQDSDRSQPYARPNDGTHRRDDIRYIRRQFRRNIRHLDGIIGFRCSWISTQTVLNYTFYL